MEQHLTQLQKALEDSQNLVDSLARSNDEMHYAKEKLLAEIEDINAGLKREQESRDQLQVRQGGVATQGASAGSSADRDACA